MDKIDFSYFDKNTNRFNTNCCKWNCEPDEIPMWIADMDFEVAPSITKAMQERLNNKIFGYTEIDDEWYNAYINWFQRRYDITYKKEWLMFVTGVVPAISSTVRKITTPGENVCVLTPVYNIFFNSIINNGRNPIESKLVYKNGEYNIDFDYLEEKLSNPQTSLLIVCNPHNPIGKIWSEEELYKIAVLTNKYNVTVLCDEIHCDLTKPGLKYVPYLKACKELYNNVIICCAPTKTFNIAGLQTAAIIVPNEFLRHKVWRQINTDEVAEPNVFAAIVPIAAYNNGEEWLEALRDYIQINKDYVENYVYSNLSKYCDIIKSNATYLLWLDFSKTSNNSEEVVSYLKKEAKVILSDGIKYHGNGMSFIRINVACPFERVKDAMNRIKIALNNYKK